VNVVRNLKYHRNQTDNSHISTKVVLLLLVSYGGTTNSKTTIYNSIKDNPINTNRTIHMTNIETQKQGYFELIELCLGDAKKIEVSNFIDTLHNYNGDENYYTTLNSAKEYLDNNGIHFIMALDWKQEITDLVWRINSSLRDNFNTKIELPYPTGYGKNASVSAKNVFKDFDKSIQKQNFKLGFIDTNSDEYVIIIHKVSDENEVKEATKKIGYPYLDVNSPKINNED
jgi:hypothetical protein